MTRIVSKPSTYIENNFREVDFFIDIDGNYKDPNVVTAIEQLRLVANRVTEVGTPEVPWFPTRFEDLNLIGKTTLGEGDGIQEADHPGFRDEEYKKRRDYISKVSRNYMINDKEIPSI